MLRVAVALTLFLALANGQGSFRLANYYQNDMVLQMAPKSAVIWGYGEVDARIEINYENIQIITGVNVDGTWRVELLQHDAGGPINFEIIHNNAETINLSAWFGDVWVCSGQSNMEMPIGQIFNFTEEINIATTYKNIRLLQLTNSFSLDTELAEATGFSIPWSIPSESNVPSFSALCLLFGERLSQSLGNSRPIGLIDSTWGGTRIEAWFSERVPNYCNTPPNDGTEANSQSALWNAMIVPLTKTSVRGAIWYQGESNVGWNAGYYACHILAMIQDWKNTFFGAKVGAENDVAFPFGVVQIGPTERGEDYSWGDLRFHQTGDRGFMPSSFIPEGFMASAYDLTDRNSPTGDIHPRDKQTLADRLSNSARAFIYKENFSAYGPRPIDWFLESADRFVIVYDRDIKIVGTDGFAVQKSDGTWSPTTITSSTANAVYVAVDADAVLLTYAYRATVCEYKLCAIYSNDEESLPALVWKWDLTAQ